MSVRGIEGETTGSTGLEFHTSQVKDVGRVGADSQCRSRCHDRVQRIVERVT